MGTKRSCAKHPIKASVTTFEVVEGLKTLDGAGVSELADHLGRNKSSVHNYLSTLEQEGYVRKKGKQYHVGLQFLGLGGHARQKYPVYEVAHGEIRDLAEKTGERVHLVVEEHGRGFYLLQETGSQAVKVDVSVGSEVHLHNTAVGKAILANLPEERVDRILNWHGMPKTTEHTITNRDALKDELRTVRKEGVAFDREERLKTLRCVAVPILNEEGHVEGAISVSGPKTRFQGDRFKKTLPNRLQQVADVIELNLTYG